VSDAQLSPELIRFIQTSLPSYDAAVVLVHLSRVPERVWTPETLAQAMGMDVSGANEVHRLLEDFVQSGVLEIAGEGEFRLAPAEHPSRAILDELRIAYDRRPVTLVRAIDAVARTKIQSFADAFRLKRERD
jgi:hypothetical protein